MIMNVFEAVRDTVTARQAAEAFGIRVKRSGMARCPFHDDRNPSMKVDNRFHCFGCQADGDAIDFTARLFDLSKKDAAVKLADTLGSFMKSLTIRQGIIRRSDRSGRNRKSKKPRITAIASSAIICIC